MIKKIPIVACPINISDIFYSVKNPEDKLKEVLKDLFNLRFIYLFNSATSSFYSILEALKKIDKRDSVVLPAYTASSLVFAIKKAKLKVVLCDINLEDFNLDKDYLNNIISSSTLAIVGVHMFGIVEKTLLELKNKYPDIFIIEDCAQSFGSRIKNRLVGSLGDVSFFSFNRGKNIPAYGGGALLTDNETIAKNINPIGKKKRKEFFSILKLIGLFFASNPYFYGVFFKFLSRFKNKMPPSDFLLDGILDTEAKIIKRLLERLDYLSKKRYENAMFLYNNLSGCGKIRFPKIDKDTMPAFNRLPILIKDLKLLEVLEKNLLKEGIETSRMYLKPLHHIFDLGYKKEDFKNANYFASHLLTLPVHPLLLEKDLFKIVKVIKKI